MKIAAVVVTYNRISLLKVCVQKLLEQTRIPDMIIIVNNGSTDGTEEWLKTLPPVVKVINQANLGSSGGCNSGFRSAMESGVDWVWTMDDDCNPDANALNEIVSIKPQIDTIYGSIALNEQNPKKIVWWIADEKRRGRYISDYSNINTPLYYTRHTIPFLGLFAPKEIIHKIGFPEKNLILWNDDEEYCFRAMSNGFRLCYVTKSILKHPPVAYKEISLFGIKTYIYETTYQKNRYFFRNSTYVAKKYNSFFKFYLCILPVKIIKAAIHSCNSIPSEGKLKNYKTYLSAILSGIRGELGFIK
ncbi:MAG TPA: glycosyltransferase [Sphingobacteriaceae bacterium]|nr:glycosyltransferase [Sphingobacteriaceae bacterium]